MLTWQPDEHTATSCSRVETVEFPADRIATNIADKFMPILEEQTKLIAKTTEENRECKKIMETRTGYLEKALAVFPSCSQWSGESHPRRTGFVTYTYEFTIAVAMCNQAISNIANTQTGTLSSAESSY